MNIIVAIDSFKGCMSSGEANEAVREGLKEARRDVRCRVFNVSDGGEGFLQAMKPEETFTCLVHDAMMRPTQASWGVKDGYALIETAQAVGLGKIEPELRNPLKATSYGVGELMINALCKGFRKMIIGLGGSAVSDCGLGMLRCLKSAAPVWDNHGETSSFDISQFRNIQVVLATDVDNPLLGPSGAVAVFAPQKGADAGMVRLLERRASTFAHMAAVRQGFDMSFRPGAGAAGGLGYAFMQFMDAVVESGGELVMKSVGIDDALAGADLVITGEGHADGQTLMGKLPSVLLRHAKAAHVPVVLLAGRVSDRSTLLEAGFSRVISINDGFPVDDNLMETSTAAMRLAMTARSLVL